MTPPSEDLRLLWQLDSGSTAINQQELWLKLQQRANKFDRTIRWRDIREIAAGLFIAVFFLWFAVRAGSPWSRAANLWLAAYGVWIIFFLLRFSRVSRKPQPEQTLAVYRRELLERYDRQIRLLRNAKYWYVLPLWIGWMLTSIAYLAKGGGKVGCMVLVTVFSAVSAGVWWVNAVPGVRHVERQRRELVSLIGEEGEPK